MDPEEFRRTRQLFDAALQQPPAERPAFLKRASGSNDDLRDRVQRLVSHAEGDSGPSCPAASRVDQRAPTPARLPQVASVGMRAPEFILPAASTAGPIHRMSLSEFAGRWLILFFYPHDFSLICPSELSALSTRIDEIREAGAEVVGVSVDSVESHQRWLTLPRDRGGLGGLAFPLASDVDGSVSQMFGGNSHASWCCSRSPPGCVVICPTTMSG